MKKPKNLLWKFLLTLLIFLLILSGIFIIYLNSSLMQHKIGDNKKFIKKSKFYIPHSQLLFYNNFTNNYSYPINLLDFNDYNLIANRTFKFNMVNDKCRTIKNQTLLLLLILIHSDVKNFEKRKIIRKTWGNNVQNKNVIIYFVLGVPVESENNIIKEKLIEENLQFNDIIQGDFFDTYRNLTLKHLTSLKCAIYHCPNAKYILKTDDDVFVNLPLLKNFLLNNLSPFGAQNLLFCKVQFGAIVKRTYRSKWRVSFKEYPEKTFPTYCPGFVILYSQDILFNLYKNAQNNAEFFWIDDVYVTGTLADKLKIIHTDNSKLIISKIDQYNLINNKIFPKKPFLFGLPDLNQFEIEQLWIELQTKKNVPKFIENF